MTRILLIGNQDSKSALCQNLSNVLSSSRQYMSENITHVNYLIKNKQVTLIDAKCLDDKEIKANACFVVITNDTYPIMYRQTLLLSNKTWVLYMYKMTDCQKLKNDDYCKQHGFAGWIEVESCETIINKMDDICSSHMMNNINVKITTDICLFLIK